MDFGLSAEEQSFREEVSSWMHEHLTGEFAQLAGRGGPGDEHSFIAERMAWERELASGGWTCVGWPTEHGGRGLPLHLEVIFHEEYSRAGGPRPAGPIGGGPLGPPPIHLRRAHQHPPVPPGHAHRHQDRGPAGPY